MQRHLLRVFSRTSWERRESIVEKHTSCVYLKKSSYTRTAPLLQVFVHDGMPCIRKRAALYRFEWSCYIKIIRKQQTGEPTGFGKPACTNETRGFARSIHGSDKHLRLGGPEHVHKQSWVWIQAQFPSLISPFTVPWSHQSHTPVNNLYVLRFRNLSLEFC